jgi:hypothetical protein
MPPKSIKNRASTYNKDMQNKVFFFLEMLQASIAIPGNSRSERYTETCLE